MASIRGPARAMFTLGSALLILTGCDKFTHDDSQWARAALERNPDLTIVATDKDANTFTVQVKGSNELRVLRADQVIGTVPSTGIAEPASEPSEPARAAPASEEPAPAAQGAEPPQNTASRGEAAQPADESSARSPSAQANAGVAPGTGVITDPTTGRVIASTDSAGKVSAAGETAAVSTATPASSAGGKLLASGPGYSISAGEPRMSRPLRLAEASELKSPANVVFERRYEPMICQGSRMLRIDGRNLEFEGDAVSALDGCEIHITNSHIIAHGLGISARAANVHIKNSIVEGDAGSVSASEGARIYTQQSTFKGLSRRLDSATFQDLGGTVWN
ncbi:MAG: hypothetical protein WDO56_00430 [Gammaproteobacteria bacterium]